MLYEEFRFSERDMVYENTFAALTVLTPAYLI